LDDALDDGVRLLTVTGPGGTDTKMVRWRVLRG